MHMCFQIAICFPHNCIIFSSQLIFILYIEFESILYIEHISLLQLIIQIVSLKSNKLHLILKLHSEFSISHNFQYQSWQHTFVVNIGGSQFMFVNHVNIFNFLRSIRMFLHTFNLLLHTIEIRCFNIIPLFHMVKLTKNSQDLTFN